MTGSRARWPSWALVAALCLATLAPAACVYTRSLRAHEVQAGWHYNSWCCSTDDCGPLAEAVQLHNADGLSGQLLGGWRYTNHKGRSAPLEPGYTRLLQSPDGLTHACVWFDATESRDRLRCLYVPAGN